jgi:hypothetical protein
VVIAMMAFSMVLALQGRLSAYEWMAICAGVLMHRQVSDSTVRRILRTVGMGVLVALMVWRRWI